MNAKRKPYSFIFLVFIDTNRDAGADGKSKLYYGTNGTPRYNNPNKFFALDAFSYSLEYYSNDYKPIKESIPVSNLLTTIPAGSGYKTAVKDSGLYNGNITRTVVSMRQSGNTSPLITVAGYAYQYDRLNRIKLMQTCLDNTAKDVQTNNTWQGISVTTKYKNSYSYDGNGNITKLRRYDDSGNLMDRLSYNYFSNNNKLKFVHDSAGTTSYAGDLEDQSHSNYNYNQIGSLIKDSLSDANSITWASYGLGSIYKRNGKRYSMLYDALARRTVKYNQTAQISTYNTFDASGNIMGIYEMKVGSNGYLNLYIKELPIYGSSRLGVLKPDRALTYINGTAREYQQPNPHIFASTYCSRRYELTNHLGNVMVTIKDKRIAVDANSNGITDYYLPDVESTIDYYPFGQEMPGRVYSPTSYRYGFNGKENDNEVAGTGNWQNYGMREYDARVCRFISVDPLTAKFPWYTPFQFAGNKPMIAVDLDGLEERIVIRTNTKEGNTLVQSMNWKDVFPDQDNGKLGTGTLTWIRSEYKEQQTREISRVGQFMYTYIDETLNTVCGRSFTIDFIKESFFEKEKNFEETYLEGGNHAIPSNKYENTEQDWAVAGGVVGTIISGGVLAEAGVSASAIAGIFFNLEETTTGRNGNTIIENLFEKELGTSVKNIYGAGKVIYSFGSRTKNIIESGKKGFSFFRTLELIHGSGTIPKDAVKVGKDIKEDVKKEK